MKNSIIIKMILPGLIVALFIASCKENEPKGDEFSWSPDGKQLAMVNVESKELLLIELDEDKIDKITSVATYSGEKAKIYSPSWSFDGQYLLYAKSGKTSLEYFVYSLKENKLTRIDQISVNEKTEVNGKVFCRWSPNTNRILWLSWNNLGEHLLFSGLRDGKDKKLLIKLNGEKVYPPPAWSPDGEWIAYSVYVQDGNKSNGLWKMKYDGSYRRQILPANGVTAFQWQPDGSHLAVVQKVIFQKDQKQDNFTEVKYHYELSVIDSNGRNKKLLSDEKLQIVELAWSSDGKQFAFFQIQNDSRDLWVVNLSSNKKVKLNFNKVQDFFGWGNPDQLLFTIDYPEDLVSQTKEQMDARELLETLRGVQKENLLIMSDRFQLKKVNKNISALTVGGQNGAVVYYKSFKPEVMGDETYYPVIEFANGERIHPARTKAQYVSAADECYLNQKYHDAVNNLSQYWKVDLNSADFRTIFDFDKIIEKMNTNLDSSRYNILMEGFKDGTLLRTVMTIRKLNQTEKADWLFEQFKNITLFVYNNEKDKKSSLDQPYFWTIMGTYGRYNEFSSGIKDLDLFLHTEHFDSILVTYINYAQSILALENKQYELGLERLNLAIKYLPQNMAELDDIKDLISLYASNFKGKEESMLLPILQQVIQCFATDENIFMLYEILGDLYLTQGQKEKALEAYQNAISLHFDRNEIWGKILALR